ncbi:MAG: cytochrome c [Acidobacteria bacterium]|nr:cytochrome c [Acidobacteriota bacterium]
MVNKRFFWIAGLILATLLMVAGNSRPYRWWPINDMSEQPNIKPFHENSLREPAPGSIAVDQWDAVPQRALFMTGEADMVNPFEATPESVATGQKLFNIYCISCHGKEMRNDPGYQSPVQAKGMPGVNIEITRIRSDGYLFATLTHGSAIMKRYSYHLSPEERWHVINYIHHLQQMGQ